ncbi:hypothetical protein R6Q57_026466 [Mikania cordata]
MSSSSPVFSSSSSSSDSEGVEVFISLLSAMAQQNASQIPRPIIRRLQINRDREPGQYRTPKVKHRIMIKEIIM